MFGFCCLGVFFENSELFLGKPSYFSHLCKLESGVDWIDVGVLAETIIFHSLLVLNAK